MVRKRSEAKAKWEYNRDIMETGIFSQGYEVFHVSEDILDLYVITAIVKDLKNNKIIDRIPCFIKEGKLIFSTPINVMNGMSVTLDYRLKSDKQEKLLTE